MLPAPPAPDSTVVLLSGAGLSAASGIPTFRDPGGLWEGFEPQALATPEAWREDPDRVQRFYDWRRERARAALPNPGHRALVRLQAAWGPARVRLVTQNVDGLLQRAAAEEGLPVEVIEMHGSLEWLRCERDADHAWLPAPEGSTAQCQCPDCGARARPAIIWFGEVPLRMGDIAVGLSRCSVFVSVGTSGVVYPAAGFAREARRRGARCVEINPVPSGSPTFDDLIAQGAEVALPALVASWLGD